jgi:hypothetical protein
MGFLSVTSSDETVRLKIQGIKEIQQLPLEYYELIYGTYNLKAFGIGFESTKKSIVIERQKTTKVDMNLNPKEKAKAVRYSLMFPGGGQFYSDNKAKGVFFSAATVGITALLGTTFTAYQDENPLVDQYRQDYQNAELQHDIETKAGIYQTQVNTVNDLQSQLIIYGSSLVATYLINVIDAKFFSRL